jgi:hypothetical protein
MVDYVQEPILLVVEKAVYKVDGPNQKSRSGRYCVRLGHDKGQILLKSAKLPFYDSARALLKLGVDPSVPLAFRHAGINTVCMTSTVGDAARWSISEPDKGIVRRVLWQEFNPRYRN